MKRKAIIFGSGPVGTKAWFEFRDSYDIVAFSDADPALWGKKSGGRNILPPDEIPSALGADGMLIICDGNHRFIVKIIEAMGVACAVYAYIQAIDSYALMPYSSKTGFDLSGIYRHYYGNIKVEPYELFPNISWKCNLKCKYCFAFGEHPISVDRVNMSWDVVNALASQLKDVKTMWSLNLAGFGEPLMNPEWFEMCSHLLKETTMTAFTVTTNAMTLTKENADKLARLPCDRMEIRISIDGDSPQELEFQRVGTRYETVKRNIDYAYKRLDKNKTNFLLLNSNLLPPDYIGAGKSFPQAYAYFMECGEWLRKDFPMLAEKVICRQVYGLLDKPIKDTAFVDFEDLSLLGLCLAPFAMITVAPNGDVLASPCSVDVTPVGNVLQDNVYDIWKNSDVLNAKREGFITGKPVCTGCIASQGTNHKFLAKKGESV